MLPQLKMYKIDYDFIISNYLDVSLWDKEWNLLVYKEHQFTLSLNSINTRRKEIIFRIAKNNYYCTEDITYNMRNTPIEVLKKQINGALFKLMTAYESYLIQQSDGWNKIYETKEQEQETLRDIARDFLNNEGVTNEDIRDAYIENFVDKNERVYQRLKAYEYNMQYKLLPDLFITFCKITNDNDRLLTVMKHIGDRQTIKNIMIEVNQFIEKLETDDYREEMEDELEGI